MRLEDVHTFFHSTGGNQHLRDKEFFCFVPPAHLGHGCYQSIVQDITGRYLLIKRLLHL